MDNFLLKAQGIGFFCSSSKTVGCIPNMHNVGLISH